MAIKLISYLLLAIDIFKAQTVNLTHVHTLDKLYSSLGILNRLLSPLLPRNGMLSLKWMNYMSNRKYQELFALSGVRTYRSNIKHCRVLILLIYLCILSEIRIIRVRINEVLIQQLCRCHLSFCNCTMIKIYRFSIFSL